MEPKTAHSSEGVLLLAALIFSVIAGNGPLGFFKPLQPSPDMGICILTVLRGAGLEINDELMFKQQTAGIR